MVYILQRVFFVAANLSPRGHAALPVEYIHTDNAITGTLGIYMHIDTGEMDQITSASELLRCGEISGKLTQDV